MKSVIEDAMPAYLGLLEQAFINKQQHGVMSKPFYYVFANHNYLNALMIGLSH